MKIIAFFKSSLGNLVLFLIFIGVGGLMFYQGNQREKAQTTGMTRVESTEGGLLHTSIVRASTLFKPSAIPSVQRTPGSLGGSTAAAEGIGTSGRTARARSSEPAKPRIPPLSLINVSKITMEESELSKTYAPYGRMIPCETVITLESSKLDTPVVGLVTDDVWHNGRLIIPAGAEVHGRAAIDRARERIAASGKWIVVWRDTTDMNGTELVLNGIALERDKNDTSGEFGMRDGSAGLLGDLIRTDNLQEIKLFASTFLAGMAGGLQKLQTQTSAFGETQITTGTARDSALKGTADVLNTYARQIQEAIARDGFFVRVPAGKQFYIYVTETIDQGRATRANRGAEELWKRNHEN